MFKTQENNKVHVMKNNNSSSFCLLVLSFALIANRAVADEPAGDKLFASTCAACHQADGSGLPGSYPALKGDAVVAGDPDTLVRILLVGPANVLPSNRPHYSGMMPPFAGLSDDKIAAILTYIRANFGNGASAVEATRVAAVRASLPQ